jgi:hypothetical protein
MTERWRFILDTNAPGVDTEEVDLTEVTFGTDGARGTDASGKIHYIRWAVIKDHRPVRYAP